MEEIVYQLNERYPRLAKFTAGLEGEFFIMEFHGRLTDMQIQDMRKMLDVAEQVAKEFKLKFVMGTVQPSDKSGRRFAIQFRRR